MSKPLLILTPKLEMNWTALFFKMVAYMFVFVFVLFFFFNFLKILSSWTTEHGELCSFNSSLCSDRFSNSSLCSDCYQAQPESIMTPHLNITLENRLSINWSMLPGQFTSCTQKSKQSQICNQSQATKSQDSPHHVMIFHNLEMCGLQKLC